MKLLLITICLLLAAVVLMGVAAQLTNLHVFNGGEHPFADKNPVVLDINKMK